MDPKRMRSCKCHDCDRDSCSVHVDGGTQRDGDGILLLVQTQILAQGHVHGDIGGGASCEESGDAAFAQAPEYQRIGIAAKGQAHDEGIADQHHEGHRSHEQEQQLAADGKLETNTPWYDAVVWRSLIRRSSLQEHGLFFRYPDLFDMGLALSGVYDSKFAFGDYMDDLVYQNSPVDYLRNMPWDHYYMDLYRNSQMIICVGQGAWEDELLAGTRRLDRVLKEKNIPVIAYDRLIMNSDAVSYYATFDNYMVGTKQGEYIVEALDLENADGPFNIELVTGDPGDNNAKFFFGGAMDVLQPYIDAGTLVVKSGQTDFETVATANWSTEAAQTRMDAIISANYADGTVLDAVLCSNDSTALGVTNSLEANYTGEWPIITGQDCDVANVKNMIAGKQAMSIFKDTRTLASKVVEMVDAIMQGGEAPVNDTETYDNGTGVIPSYLCEPVFADASNYKELLVDSGYYKESDLQ